VYFFGILEFVNKIFTNRVIITSNLNFDVKAPESNYPLVCKMKNNG
jgi:hypothetical protein